MPIKLIQLINTQKMLKTYNKQGTKQQFLGSNHPQTYGQSEKGIQVLKDMLQGCVLDFLGSWDMYIPLMEFAYNNSYQSNIGMAPYEALYGRKCRVGPT